MSCLEKKLGGTGVAKMQEALLLWGKDLIRTSKFGKIGRETYHSKNLPEVSALYIVGSQKCLIWSCKDVTIIVFYT